MTTAIAELKRERKPRTKKTKVDAPLKANRNEKIVNYLRHCRSFVYVKDICDNTGICERFVIDYLINSPLVTQANFKWSLKEIEAEQQKPALPIGASRHMETTPAPLIASVPSRKRVRKPKRPARIPGYGQQSD